jgi:hypothetical protein
MVFDIVKNPPPPAITASNSYLPSSVFVFLLSAFHSAVIDFAYLVDIGGEGAGGNDNESLVP